MPTKTRTLSGQSLVLALDGREKDYPVCRYSNGREFFERPHHNPFAGIGGLMLLSPEGYVLNSDGGRMRYIE